MKNKIFLAVVAAAVLLTGCAENEKMPDSSSVENSSSSSSSSSSSESSSSSSVESSSSSSSVESSSSSSSVESSSSSSSVESSSSSSSVESSSSTASSSSSSSSTPASATPVESKKPPVQSTKPKSKVPAPEDVPASDLARVPTLKTDNLLRELYYLDIGDTTSRGDTIIGKCSDGVGYIAKDERWDDNQEVIIGYWAGGTLYHKDKEAWHAAHDAEIQADVDWFLSHGGHFG